MSTAATQSPPEHPPGESPAAAPPEPEKKKTQPRPYVVLREIVNEGQSPSHPAYKVWEFVRNVDATSAEQAVNRAAEMLAATSDDPLGEVTLVAVTATRFKPITLAPDTKPRFKKLS